MAFTKAFSSETALQSEPRCDAYSGQLAPACCFANLTIAGRSRYRQATLSALTR